MCTISDLLLFPRAIHVQDQVLCHSARLGSMMIQQQSSRSAQVPVESHEISLSHQCTNPFEKGDVTDATVVKIFCIAFTLGTLHLNSRGKLCLHSAVQCLHVKLSMQGLSSKTPGPSCVSDVLSDPWEAAAPSQDQLRSSSAVQEWSEGLSLTACPAILSAPLPWANPPGQAVPGHRALELQSSHQ